MDITFTYIGDRITGFTSEPEAGESSGVVDNALLTHGYDHEFYTFTGGSIVAKNQSDVNAIIAKRAADLKTEELQAQAEQVVMQHMVKEKVAELTWNSGKQYHIGDVVYHAGKMWVATDDNISNEPDSIPGDWKETD